ncbi:RNA polymerase ECF-type sigma factor [Aquipluma nitroreducens]|uniref:RNA polymerase ECF-type sigma factor n=1 Tax=Aquipluma nitroreducens TaxID=2010828 RepID=A0A5K7SAZ7_9BACT|nr:RNA polymerase sigma-70 factor [Aquipluma nitroreducens]BBE18636.1 RNA polymerase ECF-type sigma factor [Aquipluma nitroreducens]
MLKQNFKNDAEALLQMSDGNAAAYRFLFDHHFTDLCNFLLIYLHSKELSEEIALEIFTFIWEKRQTLQIKANFKSFLFSSAKNRAISLYRKEQKKMFTSIDPGQSVFLDDSSSQQLMENNELREIINTAINKLPEKSKQIYQLAWEENLSHKEIAEQLGITPKTVENHVGIALRKLRESLNPYYQQIFMLLLVQLFID